MTPIQENPVRRIDAIDSLRGLAASLVVFHHLIVHFPHWFTDLNPALRRVLLWIGDQNYLAVLFFFLLSGFSIGLSVKRLDLTGADGFNQYLYRRFKRILPLYWFALGVTALLGIAGTYAVGPDFHWTTAAGNLAFLQSSASDKGNWFIPFGLNGALWSLSYEMVYYLAFPGLVWLFSRQTATAAHYRRLTLVFGISVLALAGNQIFPNPVFAFLSLLFIWYLGYFLAVLFINPRVLNQPGDRWIIPSLMLVVLIIQFIKPSQTVENWGFSLFTALLAIGIAWSANRFPAVWTIPESILNALFNRIGHGSYALYLLHVPVLVFLEKTEMVTSFWWIMLILAAVIEGCYRLETWMVSRPFLLFKRNWVGQS